MAAWISIPEIHNWSGADIDNGDAQILADSSTDAVRGYIERELSVSDYDEIYDSNGTDYILLDNWPIVAVSSVSIAGGNPLGPSGVNQAGFRIDRFVLRKLQFVGYGKIPRCQQNISVAYTAGYDFTLPASAPSPGPGLAPGPPSDLITALQLTASAIYNAAAADPNLSSESTGGVFSGSFYPTGVGAVPPGARTLLQRFKRVAP
jgi:hypothetical protein